MYRNAPFEKFKRATKSVLEHLFDDHRFCDRKWCIRLREQEDAKQNLPGSNPAGPGERSNHPPSPERSPPPARSQQPSRECPEGEEAEREKRSKKGYYRSKRKHEELYVQMKPIFEELTTDKLLWECLHGYESQINEALNLRLGSMQERGERTAEQCLSQTG